MSFAALTRRREVNARTDARSPCPQSRKSLSSARITSARSNCGISRVLSPKLDLVAEILRSDSAADRKRTSACFGKTFSQLSAQTLACRRMRFLDQKSRPVAAVRRQLSSRSSRDMSQTPRDRSALSLVNETLRTRRIVKIENRRLSESVGRAAAGRDASGLPSILVGRPSPS